MTKPVVTKRFSDLTADEKAELAVHSSGRRIVSRAQRGDLIWCLFDDDTEEVRGEDGKFAKWPE